MTRERLRQVESLLLELEEERERFSREKRHRERMEIHTASAACSGNGRSRTPGTAFGGSRRSAGMSRTRCGSGSTAFPTP